MASEIENERRVEAMFVSLRAHFFEVAGDFMERLSARVLSYRRAARAGADPVKLLDSVLTESVNIATDLVRSVSESPPAPDEGDGRDPDDEGEQDDD